MSIVGKIFATPVTADMLQRANDAAAERSAEAREQGEKPDFVEVFLAVAGALDGDGPGVAPAVVWRLQALSRLIKARALKGWTMEVAGRDYVLVSDALFHAAAKATLKEEADEVVFDAEEVLRLALEFGEEEGSA